MRALIASYLTAVLAAKFLTLLAMRRYWHQRAKRGLATLLSKVDPGAFSGQRQGWNTPKRTFWQCTASVCVAEVHCWEISLG